MSLLFPEIVDPNIPLKAKKIPCVISREQRMWLLASKIENKIGIRVSGIMLKSGYWYVELGSGWAKVSNLLKMNKPRQTH